MARATFFKLCGDRKVERFTQERTNYRAERFRAGGMGEADARMRDRAAGAEADSITTGKMKQGKSTRQPGVTGVNPHQIISTTRRLASELPSM